MLIAALEKFIVMAKAKTYVGQGDMAPPSRSGAHDLVFTSGDWSYRDSYFGGTDFLGQEVVWFENAPKWAMNYYGYILQPDLINADISGTILKAALSKMYKQGRFLGGFEWVESRGTYRDSSTGDVAHFKGHEVIVVDNVEAYALDYHGGLIKA